MSTENLRRAQAEAKGPTRGILGGTLFGITIIGLMQSANALAQGHLILATIFSLFAPIGMTLNAKYVVPVWRGKSFRESALLFGGAWLYINLLAALFALGFWYFKINLFPLPELK